MIIRRLLILVALLIAFSITAHAQTGEIAYGEFTSGTLEAETPARFLNFNGSQNDLISIEAIALTPDLDPRISLLSGGSATLVVNSDDPYQPGTTNARLTYRLPETGTYTILVETEGGTTGQYLLLLNRLDIPPAQQLGAGVITPTALSPDVSTVAFAVDSSQGTTVTVTSPIEGYTFVAELQAPDGQTLTVGLGGLARQFSTSIAPNTGTYQLVLRTGSANTSGNLEINFSDERPAAPVEQAAAPQPEADSGTEGDDTSAEQPPTQAPVQIIQATPVPETNTDDDNNTSDGDGDDNNDGDDEEGGTVSNLPENRCTATPSLGGGVNIRQGPSLDFPVIASIPLDEFRYVDGTDGVWIRLVGNGWVSSGVVDLNGPCGNIPTVAGPTPANQPPPPTATVVNPVGQQ